MLDEHGYPTEETLEEIRNWHPLHFHSLAKKLVDLWLWKDYIKLDGNVLKLSTGGWSGHEEIIANLPQTWKALYTYSWRRGGHYVFKNLYENIDSSERKDNDEGKSNNRS